MGRAGALQDYYNVLHPLDKKLITRYNKVVVIITSEIEANNPNGKDASSNVSHIKSRKVL